jgi:hypothetical protein
VNQYGFLSSLFDLSFSQFITLKLIKVIFVLNLVFAAFMSLSVIAMGFRAGFVYGFMALVVGAPLTFLFIAAIGRMWLELTAVAFRGVEHLRGIETNTQRASQAAPTAF